MAITFPNGFAITSQEAIDVRLVMTKEQMASAVKANMPAHYFALCSDDGKIYLYDSSNEKTSELGRFREYSANKISTDAISAVLSPDTDNALEMTENGLKATAGKMTIIE